jgi:DNA-binding CsgD family transcriptional regulator
MDDLNLLHLCIEQMHHSTTQKLLQERCIPWLKEMGMDEKNEARVIKKIGLEAWADLHKVQGTITRLVYVYLSNLKISTAQTKRAINPKDLHKMVQAGKTTTYIAKKLGVHRDSVRRAIVRFGYTELYDSNRKKSKSQKILDLLRADSSMDNRTIAAQAGTQPAYVAKLRHTHGFTHKTSKPTADYFNAKLAEGLCAKEIASELGLSHRTIQTYFSAYSIKVSDAPAYQPLDRKVLDMLIDAGMSVEEIADHLCKAPSTIRTYIYQYRIHEKINSRYRNNLLFQISQCRTEGYTNQEIADKLGISVSYICATVRKHNLPSKRTRTFKDMQNYALWEEEEKK